MPTYEKGDYIIPIEQIVNMSYTTFLSIVDEIISSKDCSCTISDYPSIASVIKDKYIIDIVIGASSIVCNKKCDAKSILEKEGISYFEFSSTAWIYGRFVNRVKECLTTRESLAFLKNNLQPLAHYIPWIIDSFDRILEVIPLEKRNAFSLILPKYDPLGFLEQRYCGRIHTRNPLYPGAALGKVGIEVCVNHYTKVVGPLGRKLLSIIDISNEPLISLYNGIGDALLLHVGSNHLHPVVLKALTLSILYTCSEGD